VRKPETNHFIYSAYAQSIGGIVHKPLKAFLSDAPGVALPVTGGVFSQTKENVYFKADGREIFRVGRASASVLGERRDDHYLTAATAVVEKLNILDILTADRVVAKVTSLYPVIEPTGRDQEEGGMHPAHFFISGSHFDNLKIDGKPYECLLDPPEREEGFMVKSGEATRTPIFKEECRQIHIHQFGTIHLGEKFMYGEKVILSMFRIELGCPNEGPIPGPTACSNGKNGL